MDLPRGLGFNVQLACFVCCDSTSPHVDNVSSFRAQAFMSSLSPRAVGAIVAVSHLVRSWFASSGYDWAQLDSDIQAFRQEVARGQRLLAASSSALEACSREAEIQRFLLKASGVAEVILVVALVILIFCRRTQGRSSSAVEFDSGKSDQEDSDWSPLQIESSLPAKHTPDRGPLTPSALKQLAAGSFHGGSKDIRH